MYVKPRLVLQIVVLLALSQFLLSATDTNKLNKRCNSDTQCSPPYIVCHESKCQHKRLFSMTGAEVATLVILFVVQGVASIVGIAGGIFVVPLTVLLMGFSAGQATALANAFATMSTFCKYLIGINKRDPVFPFKTMIEYNGVMTLLPAMTLFSTIGGIVGSFLPEVLVLFILVVTLIGSIISGVIQLRAQLIARKNRIQLAQKPEVNFDQKAETKEQTIKVETIDTQPQQSERTSLRNDSKSQAVVQAPEESNIAEIEAQKLVEGSNFVLPKVVLPVFIVILAILLALFRGGKTFKSIIGLKKCSAGDWSLLVVYFLILSALPFYTYYIIEREQRRKASIGWKSVCPEEVPYTKRMIILTFIFCSLVGFLSTVIGIGGAILLIPFLTAQKFMPVKSSYMIIIATLISKIAAVIIHIVSGDLMTDYTLFFGVLITLSAVLAEFAALWVVKKYKSQLLYPSIFVCLTIISFVLTLAVGINKWKTDNAKGIDVWKFKTYC